MARVGIKILVPNAMRPKDLGKRFFELFLRCFPTHIPDRISNSVNQHARFVPGRWNDILRKWSLHHLFLSGDHPHIRLQITRAKLPLKRHREIILQPFDAEIENTRQFVYEAAEMFAADFAAAHIFTKIETDCLERKVKPKAATPNPKLPHRLARKRVNGDLWWSETLWSRSLLLVQTEYLRKYIPDLYWLTIFGPPYVRLFGREKLLTVPVHATHEIRYGAIGIELTGGLSDTVEDWRRLAALRERAKEHLDTNAFFDRRLPKTHVYSVPHFEFDSRAQ